MSWLIHSAIHQVMWCFCLFIVNLFSILGSLFFLEKAVFPLATLSLFIAESISLDTSGKPTVGFFLKITSPSWMILSISLDELNSIDCWRADDEFSGNNFSFIVVKEFWYSKKYYRFFGECLNIIFWILLWMLTWNLNITVSTILKYCTSKP